MHHQRPSLPLSAEIFYPPATESSIRRRKIERLTAVGFWAFLVLNFLLTVDPDNQSPYMLFRV